MSEGLPPPAPTTAPRRKRLRSIVRRSDDGSRLPFRLDTGALMDLLVTVGPALVLVVVAFWVAAKFVKPAPPDSFVMTTGAEGGAYHLVAQKYRDILARNGITVELRPSAGSIDNLKRLTDPASGVHAGLVQGGLAPADGKSGLLSLGAVYYEPLWIFYRARAPLDRLNALVGQRIAVGPEGSGTRALATQLMHAVRTDAAPTRLLPLGGSAAADALDKGDADAAFIVGSPDAPVVQRLLRTHGVRLMSIVNADAFARHFPFLSTVRLPRGVIDLAADVPDAEVTMLATTASILVREDFHPALAFLLIYAAAEVHGKPGLLHRRGEFPTARETDFPLSEEASRYFKSGPPFLQRYLPFWMANLIERMLVLLVPIFAVVVPALKILPAVFQWRVKSRVFRWYGELKFLESEVATATDASRADEFMDRLDAIERGVNSTPVPTSYADYAYNLRTHIDVVRRHIERVCTEFEDEPETAGTAATPPV
jgi:TRAP transporter TAXI family solute receptor